MQQEVYTAPPQHARKTDANRRSRLKPSGVALTILFLVLLGAGITSLLRLGDSIHPDQVFTAEQVQMFGIVDNRAQRLAYSVGLLILAALSLTGLYAIGQGSRLAGHPLGQLMGKSSNQIKKYLGVFLIAAGTILFIKFWSTAFSGTVEKKLKPEIILTCVCLTVCALWAAKLLTTRTFTIMAWVFIITYVAFLTLPGLLRPIFLFEPLLSKADMHYSVTLAQGDRLASGLSPGKEVSFNYGCLPPILLAIFERRFGLLNFGEHIRVVQASQFIFLLMAVVAYRLWRPRNHLFVLFAILLVGPWISTSQWAIYHPNQAGWRTLGFAIGVVCLLLMRRQPLERAALALGCCAGFLVLFNPEIGLCLSFGYGLFLLSRLRSVTILSAGSIAGRSLAGAAIVLLIVLAIYRVGLGEWPVMMAALSPGFTTRFGQGYGSLQMGFDPMAFLIFAHCAYIVVVAVMWWRRRPLKFEESVKLAIGSALLIWFAYYVNRPHIWNLWTYQFLYVFLVAGFLEPRLLVRLQRKGLTAFADYRLVILTFILLPTVLTNNFSIYKETLMGMRGPSTEVATVSGVQMPKPWADVLQSRADFLARQDARTTLYFTHNSYSLSLLSQSFLRLPIQDVFTETITEEDFKRLVGEIHILSPRMILFDAPESEPEADQNPDINLYRHFFDRLKSRLSDRYWLSGTQQGWQVWELQEH